MLGVLRRYQAAVFAVISTATVSQGVPHFRRHLLMPKISGETKNSERKLKSKRVEKAKMRFLVMLNFSDQQRGSAGYQLICMKSLLP